MLKKLQPILELLTAIVVMAGAMWLLIVLRMV